MAFKEIQFPPKISMGATGGLGWLTDIVTLQSGFEQRNQTLAQPRGRWTVSHSARLAEKFNPLLAFINVVRGQTHGFRFKDWTDYTVAAGEGVFIAIDSTHKQLAKRYTFGAETFDRIIRKPVTGSVTLTGGTGTSIDYTTGIVTFSGAPSSWVGEFDVPARFGTDDMSADIIDRNGPNGDLIVGWSGIPIIELRV